MSGSRAVVFEWTEEAFNTLKRLAAAGCSASQIGLVLGVTRNAVIGKARRSVPRIQIGSKAICGNANHGLEGRARSSRTAQPQRLVTPAGLTGLRRATPAQARQRYLAYAASPQRLAAFDPSLAPSGARLVPLAALQPGQCRWPLYEDGPMVFCGCACPTQHQQGQPDSYCPHHMVLARAAVAP